MSLAELLAALALTSLLGTLLTGLLIAQLRVARNVADRALAADAIRTVRVVLEGEGRRILREDVRALEPESLSIRAFRGAAVPCADSAGRVQVRYRGDRMPDLRKDSVLVIAALSGRSLQLIDSRVVVPVASCVTRPGEVVLGWQLESAAPDAAVLLLFESGSYYMSSRALRYRIGSGGRQPLTAELFSNPYSQFAASSASPSIEVNLETLRTGQLVELVAPLAEWLPW
ncbi:hypothetical protein BH23GEM9_BH23GEM9_15300 [soil metagenome]